MIKSGEDNIRPFSQTVEFTGREDHHTIEIVSTNVNIIPSRGGHNHGSSKVKLKNIVDFTWEHRYYVGQLLAVHMSGKYLAYGIIAGNGHGVIRVVNKELEQRMLIRGMRGLIQDLAFAHIATPLLACVDSSGSLFVYSIEATNTELLWSPVLQVDADDFSPMTHRVIWCPYIPEKDATDEDEVSKLLVLTRGSTAELWSIADAARLFNAPIEATNPKIKEYNVMLEIRHHSGTIVEATFSPDGTAVATASSDGEVKFFQVHLHAAANGQQSLQCLQQWSPHDGRPISSLFFLDDHKNYSNVQFWRFAITGCDNNSEIKIWSCELWSCLQTIKFAPMPSTQKTPVLKARLDLTAGYLLLSDIYNKVLYIMSISQDSYEAVACINTVSEFLLPYPILSFVIVDAGQRRLRPTSESLEDLCPCDDENEDQLVIRMYLVQPKSLQECHIAFRLPMKVMGSLMDTLTHDSLDYFENPDDMLDIGPIIHNGIAGINENDEGENDEEETQIIEPVELTANHNAGLNLMTPDAFSSPAKKDNALDSKSCSPQLGNIESASPSIAQTVQALNTADQPLATSKLEEQAPPSGGSSPSREVREILSLAEPEENEPEVKSEERTNGLEIPMYIIKDVIDSMKDKKENIFGMDDDHKSGIKSDWQPPLKDKKEKMFGMDNDLKAGMKSEWQPPLKDKKENVSVVDDDMKTALDCEWESPINIKNDRQSNMSDMSDRLKEELGLDLHNNGHQHQHQINIKKDHESTTSNGSDDINATRDVNFARYGEKLYQFHRKDELNLAHKLECILELLQDQHQEINELRVEVTRLRQETPLANRVESTLAKAAQQQTSSIEQTLFNQTSRQQEFLKNFEVSVIEKLETTIPKVIQRIVDPLKRQLRIDVQEIDTVVQENLLKTMAGAQMQEAITKAALGAAKPAIEQAFKETFTCILLPGMEKVCQNMFKQVQDAFLVGTREYLQNVDSIMDKQYQQQNKQQSEALTLTIREEMQNEFSRGLSLLQDNTIRSVRDSMRENFTQHMSDISGIRSRATTPGLPGPTAADAQARVMSLLQRGQLNAAFQQALSASDLGLVVLVCENTDPARVFSCSMGPGQGSRCVLQQPVLLSLVQQLSANLGHRTELKHRWLEEAVISLDPNDPVTREHMVNVLLALQNQVAAFISANPTHRSVRRLKMVAMAAQALLKPT